MTPSQESSCQLFHLICTRLLPWLLAVYGPLQPARLQQRPLRACTVSTPGIPTIPSYSHLDKLASQFTFSTELALCFPVSNVNHRLPRPTRAHTQHTLDTHTPTHRHTRVGAQCFHRRPLLEVCGRRRRRGGEGVRSRARVPRCS